VALGRSTGNGLRHHATRAVGALSRGMIASGRAPSGGGVSVTRLGPKEAEVVDAKCALLQPSYFRRALRGVALGLLEVVTRGAS
jgi:hypothetical protein